MQSVETAHTLHTWTEASGVISNVTNDKLTVIIEHLQDQHQRIGDLLARITDLEATDVCTGRVHWRDLDEPNRKPKMYVIHSIGDHCPMHGKPKPGERLRIYVGTDPEKQDHILEAMERQKQRTHLESQIRQAEVRLRRIERAIDDVWRIVTDQQRWEW